jgi:endogenous inhibitor of DNA gyrase (YacG/DUF329 family)
MSDFDISTSQIQIPCPGCQAGIATSLGQVANQESVQCPACGTSVRLHDKDGATKKAIHDTKAAVDGLKNTISDINLRLG